MNNNIKEVIAGLECAIDEDHFGFKNCLHCKYRKDVDHCQWVCDGDKCISEAIDILKEYMELSSSPSEENKHDV